MNRRQFAQGAFGLAAVAATAAAATAQAADSHAGHGAHAGHAAGGKYATLAAEFAACAARSAECIAHCQKVLATGDKSLAECLDTALACETACQAVARLGYLDSRHAATFAKTSVAVMEACAAACKPHITHHAVCKACHDACVRTIDAAKAI